MADDAISSVSSMVSSLNASITNAVSALQAQQAAASTDEIKTYEKSVKKSSLTNSGAATDIGILAKNTTRLNVASTLAANDSVDFYKFKVTSKGEATLGQVGDDGVRVQLMSRLGTVLADSNKDSGGDYEKYQSLQRGELTLDKGDYTLRITRDKGESVNTDKNYALQLVMGSYSQDYDTVAKQPTKGESPFQMSTAQQSMLDGLNTAISSANSITYGQTGTEKLMGSFSLFV
ncbi:hypothetical protein ACIU1J_29425 [Azospirillum doebereinerae]|uniref:hypothetical protein n=1 Tax=Azospirillum doebereinerae TaxID=92933 RepID=UPI001EE54A36|nr:hypothetical protein [Azospirillum doebereinerae]MCG5240329.1 hypothetical protein [Azospirillum doebereinerae]